MRIGVDSFHSCFICLTKEDVKEQLTGVQQQIKEEESTLFVAYFVSIEIMNE